MSAREDREARLPEAAEALLEGWPEPERDAEFWKQAEARVTAQLGDVEAGSTPSDLLAPPLPASDEDGSLEAPRASPPERPSTPPASLAELARQAVAQARAETDSKDIARESLSLASRARASAPDLAASLAAARISRPPESPRAARLEGVPAPPAPAASHRGVFVGAAVAVVALAAVVVLGVRWHNMASDASLGNEPAAPSAAPKSVPVATAAQTPASAEVHVLSPDQLPEHPAAAPSPEHVAPARAERAVVAEKKSPPKHATTSVHASAAASKQQEPEAKMQPASGGAGVPDHPSLGAVQAAVGAVLGSARACVAGDEKPSSAVLVFGSDGHVKSVSVSGPAAGTPAAGCIRSALSRARVQPFGRSSYSVGTPIRPQ